MTDRYESARGYVRACRDRGAEHGRPVPWWLRSFYPVQGCKIFIGRT